MSTIKDLVDEAKKRVVLLLVCVFGLSYLMSLTSSSVWINIPAAAALILLGRYLSLDLDFRKKTSTHDPLKDQTTAKKSIQLHKFLLKKPNWRKKINSPPVEAAIDQFTRHLISEWVTDLWYARITPDKDGPEELVNIINSVLGEISFRARDINLINLLTRDVIGIICNNLELYRYSHLKIKKQNLRKLESEDKELKIVLAADNKLHPALLSVEAEHKVLQHLMTGLMQITFKPEDLQCTFFRYTVRELLACTVFRPILNLACPRVINEKIEALAISVANKAKKPQSSEKSTTVKPLNTLPDQNSGLQDQSTNGLELIQLRQVQSSTEKLVKKSNGENDQINHHSEKTNNLAIHSGAEWAHKLDIMSKRKTQVLAPENLESLWTKGRNYKNNEGRVRAAAASSPISEDRHTSHIMPKKNFDSCYKDQHPVAESESSQFQKPLCHNKTEDTSHEETDFESETSNETEVDESNTLDSPGTKVWDSKNKRNDVISHIHHPLEASQLNPGKKKSKSSISHSKTMKTKLGRKRARSSDIKVPLWQETERTSFLLSEGHDILHDTKSESKAVELSDDAEGDNWSRVHSGVDALSSLSSISTSESYVSSLTSPQNSVLADSFLKLRCEVVGANIVKSGSVTFAVYSIAVTDANNKSWSIKRRYRHFEELHKRLKEYPEYNLHLPPKHFLSSGLEGAIILERCKSLNKYLKILLHLPTISGSIEVWDFLSVDSQTYMFSDSLSIIQTLPVISDDKSTGSEPKILNSGQNISSQSSLNGNIQYGVLMNNNNDGNSSGLKNRNLKHVSENNHENGGSSSHPDYLGTDTAHKLHTDVPSSSNYKEPKIDRDTNAETSQNFEDNDESDIPVEWVSQNLSIPILNLVDVIFQLQDGGWIRRQAFWVAKQILQLGMGDAFDDWLIEKVQILRKETVIASAINRVEQILWPDGIFLTKHPNRKPPTPVSSPVSQNGNNTTQSNKEENQLTPEQQLEAVKRAKFVYELMIDKAPATLVSLVGRSEYERCAEDVYYFLQSSLCLKQLAFELLELILVSIFPELDDVIKQCREDKEMLGEIVDDR